LLLPLLSRCCCHQFIQQMVATLRGLAGIAESISLSVAIRFAMLGHQFHCVVVLRFTYGQTCCPNQSLNDLVIAATGGRQEEVNLKSPGSSESFRVGAPQNSNIFVEFL
jgi:hypothetical protein